MYHMPLSLPIALAFIAPILVEPSASLADRPPADRDKRAANKHDPDELDVATSRRFFPMEVGHQWVYSSDGGDVTFEVQGTEKIGDTECFVVRRTIGKQKLVFYVSVSNLGVAIHQDGNNLFEPPFLEFAFPFKKSQEWQWKGKVGKEVRSVNCKNLGLADARVPLGRFRAYVIEERIELASGESGHATFWLAEGIGVVKLVGKKEDLRNPASNTIFYWELKSFAKKDKTE